MPVAGPFLPGPVVTLRRAISRGSNRDCRPIQRAALVWRQDPTGVILFIMSQILAHRFRTLPKRADGQLAIQVLRPLPFRRPSLTVIQGLLGPPLIARPTRRSAAPLAPTMAPFLALPALESTSLSWSGRVWLLLAAAVPRVVRLEDLLEQNLVLA